MNELDNIQNKIYVIRGQRVMLDFDLATIYEVETAHLKRQVRRNIERFEGEDFMFELTSDELSRCQIGTLKIVVTFCDNILLGKEAGFGGRRTFQTEVKRRLGITPLQYRQGMENDEAIRLSAAPRRR